MHTIVGYIIWESLCQFVLETDIAISFIEGGQQPLAKVQEVPIQRMIDQKKVHVHVC